MVELGSSYLEKIYSVGLIQSSQKLQLMTLHVFEEKESISDHTKLSYTGDFKNTVQIPI